MQPNVILTYFAKFIQAELGIIYAEHNYFQLQNRLEEIGKLLGIVGMENLYNLAQKGITGQFRQLLLDLATNNETSFFRDPKVFKAVESIVLNRAAEIKSPFPLRIWSAASSTGQEALSLAMLITEFNLKTGKNIKFKISGTDISERVLNKAKLGEYTQLEIQRGLPSPLMLKYFKKNDLDKWVASTELTRNIEFSKLNLKENFSFAQGFDLVLCRNVLIYQNVESKIDIISRLTRWVQPAGYLILGSGENLMGLSNAYEQSVFDGAVLYKKLDSSTKAA